MAMPDSDLPLFPFERPSFGPPQQYAALRDQGPLRRVKLWDGKVAWLALRYEDVRALLADNRFSADTRRPGYPSITETRDREKRMELPFFVMMDPPEHTRYRKILTKEFTLAKIERLRPTVMSVVAGLIDKLLEQGPPTDLVRSFALPIPTMIIAHMLGVPYSDHEFFQHRTEKLLSIDGLPGEAAKAGDEMRAYMIDLLKEKARNPHRHDDIFGRLIIDRIQPGDVSYDEAAMLAVMLMLAGHETTANQIALSMLSLMQDREIFTAVCADESGELIRRAVEELLRFHSIVHFTGARVAREDVQYGGVTIKAGEGILPQILGANHDPSRFPLPGQFSISRTESCPHVAFGFGIHQCLGQPLARLELNVVLSTLPKRIPGLRLAVRADELPFKKLHFVHGLQALPAAW
jgi:cytochrome P450